VAAAEGLLRSLGLTSAQAIVVSAGSDEDPKLLVYVFYKRFRADGPKLHKWQGVPVEVVRMERVQPHHPSQFAVA
jgi:hypothetical protein